MPLKKSFLSESCCDTCHCYLYMYSSIRSLIISKYRDSNEFMNHFRILSVRMVPSAELAWTVQNRVATKYILKASKAS